MQKSVIRRPPRKQKAAQEKERVSLSRSWRVWEAGQDWFRFHLSVSLTLSLLPPLSPLPFSVSVTITLPLSPFLRGSLPLPASSAPPRLPSPAGRGATTSLPGVSARAGARSGQRCTGTPPGPGGDSRSTRPRLEPRRRNGFSPHTGLRRL